MKKKSLFCIIVLIIQLFTPLTIVGNAITNESGSFSLSNIMIEDDLNIDPQNIVINISGYAKVKERQQASIEIKGVKNFRSTLGIIRSESQQTIGTYQTNENNIILMFNKEIDSFFSLDLTGKLVDESISSQVIVATLDNSEVSAPITLKKDSSIQEEGTVKESLPEKTESNTTFEISKIVKREAIDIQMLLNGQQLFSHLKVTNSVGQDIANTNLELGDLLKLTMDFSLPESVREQMQAGDYYENQLPAEVQLDQNLSIKLTGLDEQIYGVMKLNKDGSFRIEFSELVEQESNIHGEISLSGELGAGNLTGPGPGEIEFPFVEEQPSIPIIVKPKTSDTIRKEGHLDRPTNPNEINWTVDVNVGLRKLTDTKVIENFPAGTTYKPEVKVYTVDVDFDGKVISGSEKEISNNKYTVDEKGNVTFIGEINEAYRLEYLTTIDSDTKPSGEGGRISYKNEAAISAKELSDEIGTSTTITANYNKMLEKQKPIYDPATQEFKWTVNYNYTEFDIPENKAIVTDEFQGKMILKDESVIIKNVTFNDQGKPSEGAALIEGVDYTLVPLGEGKGFEVQFIDGLDHAVNIHYAATVDEEVTENQEYSNIVVDGQGHKDESQGEAHQQGLVKKIGDINYVSKTIDWEIMANMNEYELNNWEMNDQMSPGLTLTLNGRTFIIHDLNTGELLEKGNDYSIEYDEAAGTIHVSFINNYVKTNHKFQINYKTKFDTTILNQQGFSEFSNDVSARWTNQINDQLTTKDKETFKPKPEEGADGFKYGNYNAITKTIVWVLGINYTRQELGGVLVTDPITSNQNFINGSLKIFKYKILTDGSTEKGVQVTGADLEQFSIIEPTEENGNVLSVGMNGIGTNDQYLLEFETSLDGEVVNASEDYHNKANIDATNVQGNFIIEGDVAINNGGTLVQKEGKQDDDGFLNWSATINPSQSTVYDAVITDNPSLNQAIDESSVILYDTTINQAGTIHKGAPLVKDSYSVALTTNNETG